MKRYLVAIKLNENSNAIGQKEQVKTFEAGNDESARAYVASAMTSNTRDLVSVALHDFTTHVTIPYEPIINDGKIILVQKTTVGGDIDA